MFEVPLNFTQTIKTINLCECWIVEMVWKYRSECGWLRQQHNAAG